MIVHVSHILLIYIYIIENYVNYIYWNHPVYLIGWGGGIGYRFLGVFSCLGTGHHTYTKGLLLVVTDLQLIFFWSSWEISGN